MPPTTNSIVEKPARSPARGRFQTVETMTKIDKSSRVIQGRVVYLFALVVLVQSVYPITSIFPLNTTGGAFTIIAYQFLYVSMIVVGIVLGRDSRRRFIILVASGALFLVSGAVYAFFPEDTWALLLGYTTLIPFQATVVQMLLRYIFSTRKVTSDVLFAASAVYLLLGGIFVPLYGLVETLHPRSFVDTAAANAPVYWQQFVYFSYSTLTTLGHGDILPLTMWARSLSNVEAVVGVLYIAVMMARLVGLYAVEDFVPGDPVTDRQKCGASDLEAWVDDSPLVEK